MVAGAENTAISTTKPKIKNPNLGVLDDAFQNMCSKYRDLTKKQRKEIPGTEFSVSNLNHLVFVLRWRRAPGFMLVAGGGVGCTFLGTRHQGIVVGVARVVHKYVHTWWLFCCVHLRRQPSAWWNAARALRYLRNIFWKLSSRLG